MTTLVIYDSVHGNTEKIARAIGDAIGTDAKVLRVSEMSQDTPSSTGLLIIGSPTHGGRPTPDIQSFLDRMPVQGVRVAVFDTRFEGRMIRLFGYAAPRMADGLKAKGANIVAPPEGFIVKGTKGPLKEGEIERAAAWTKKIVWVP